MISRVTDLFPDQITSESKNGFQLQVTSNEIKYSLFLLGSEKAPNLAIQVMRSKVDSFHYFRYYFTCDKLRITHLSFADNLRLFAAAYKDTLEEFNSLHGLSVNQRKSEVFLFAITNDIKQQIILVLLFKYNNMPVRYLGLPLVTWKSSLKDCVPLIEKITARLSTWTEGNYHFQLDSS